MSYEPTVWQCGDTITAEKLNKLEQGVANSGGGSLLVVTCNIEDWLDCGEPDSVGIIATFSHSWQEMHDSIENNIPVVIVMHEGYYTNIVFVNNVSYNDFSNTYDFYPGYEDIGAFENATDKVIRICNAK